MPSSAKDRMRKYREKIKMDPVKHEEYLQKERNRWKERTTKGKILKIDQLSEREQRSKRKTWRLSQKEHRLKKKLPETPPSSGAEMASQRKRGRKKVKQNRARCYKRINKLERQLQMKAKQINKYKQRLSRLNRLEKKDSPRTKTRKLLRHFSVDSKVRKTLTFHHALVNDLRSGYKNAKCEQVRRNISTLVTGKIVKRYRMQRLSQRAFGFSQKRLKRLENSDRGVRQKIKGIQKIKEDIKQFYSRDDNSRLTTGKKQTLTYKKEKQQKRLLFDTVFNLHQKFLSENPAYKVSYSLFCQMRPFFVVKPNLQDRQTCQCKIHENLTLMAKKLFSLNLIETASIERLAEIISCGPNEPTSNFLPGKKCMYNSCDICKDKQLEIDTSNQDLQKTVEFYQWKLLEKTYRKAGESEDSKMKVTEKVLERSTLEKLVDTFQDYLVKFRKHHFNIVHQFGIYRALKQNLSSNECIVHVDFSENYNCKYGNEIQSVHFGGSHQQASLHTGVLYLADCPKVTTFCSISDDLQHNPLAIWAHLEPVLSDVRHLYPNIETVYFWSDSPSAQYRQKLNFYLLSTELYKLGFKKGVWNFFESGHGKGAPDGVGGALKRTADRLVAQGQDVPNPKKLYEVLLQSETHIKLYFITSECIKKIERIPSLATIPGTLKIHQVVTHARGTIYYRDVSCTCKALCGCFDVKSFTFPEQSSIPESLSDNNMHVPKGIQPVGPQDIHAVGKYCVVKYDGQLYPGLIKEMDETDARVQCMHRIGNNRYYWPSIRPDICWYAYDDIITIIPEPQFVSLRHAEIDKALWKCINDNLKG